MKLNKKIYFYALILVLFLGLKFIFYKSTFDNLQFLLMPTNSLVEVLTNSDSEFKSDLGYFNSTLNIVIEKSCSGINFLLICFVMICFLVIRKFSRIRHFIMTFPIAFLCAYFLTIITNVSRIMVSIFGQYIGNHLLGVRPHLKIHETIGTIVYLLFLMLLYFYVEYLLTKIKKNYEKHT